MAAPQTFALDLLHDFLADWSHIFRYKQLNWIKKQKKYVNTHLQTDCNIFFSKFISPLILSSNFLFLSNIFPFTWVDSHMFVIKYLTDCLIRRHSAIVNDHLYIFHLFSLMIDRNISLSCCCMIVFAQPSRVFLGISKKIIQLVQLRVIWMLLQVSPLES